MDAKILTHTPTLHSVKLKFLTKIDKILFCFNHGVSRKTLQLQPFTQFQCSSTSEMLHISLFKDLSNTDKKPNKLVLQADLATHSHLLETIVHSFLLLSQKAPSQKFERTLNHIRRINFRKKSETRRFVKINPRGITQKCLFAKIKINHRE